MYVPKPHVLAQNPHTDIYAHLWSNTDDSSPSMVTITQTLTNMEHMHILSVIGQVGINTTLVILGIMFVFLTGMYEDHEADIEEQRS